LALDNVGAQLNSLFQNLTTVLTLIACLAGTALSAPTEHKASDDASYRLRLFHTHTGERLDVVYRRGSRYDAEALAQLNHYLRDHRSGAVREYDPRIFDLLHALTIALKRPDTEIDVVCGYRSPWSNEHLRMQGHGVARHSLHMRAMAIDIRVPGVRTSELRDTALALRRGGVGYYSSSNFVHVDIGRFRRW
jgi:uncharacterized protein YcbK (DUF882 family)